MWGGQPTSSRYIFGITAHQNRGAKVPGAALHDAWRSKERTYPELLNRRCRLAASGAMKLPTSSACSPLSPIQPSLPPSSHQPGFRLALVSSPYPYGSYFLCGQPAVRRSLSPPQPRRRPSTARPPPFAHEPRACQSPPSPVEEGLESGLKPSPPQAHLETGQYKNSLCLEAAQYNSPVSMDLLQLKRGGGEKKMGVLTANNLSTTKLEVNKCSSIR